MTLSDETLMAFADGELDPEGRAAVEQAMREDPDVERRVAQHRALRSRLQAAYARELEEAVPERLLAAARSRPRVPRAVPSYRWRPALAMAASVVAGVGLGMFILRQPATVIGSDAKGNLVARGVLAKELMEQVGADSAPGARVRIGLSFIAKSGDYCRTFAMSGPSSRGGLACRRDDDWHIELLAQPTVEGESAAGAYRTAGSGLPPVVLAAVQQQIAGEPLDQNAEVTARERRWQPVHR
jgi:hypothetical protein